MKNNTNSTQINRHIKALTGLRILAAFWVLVHHFTEEILLLIPSLTFTKPILDQGGLGVDLFFILSGFILTYQYLDKLGSRFTWARFTRFIRARIARVYPVHFFTLHLTVAMFFVAGLLGMNLDGGTDRSVSSYVQNLLLVHAWVDQPYSWNGVSWSVSAEWFAYLLFPVAALALFRIRSRWLMLVGAVAPIGLFIILQETVLTAGSGDEGPDHVLLRIARGFIVGCFMARLYSNMEPNAGWKWATPAAAVAVLALCYLPGISASAFILPFALLILGLAYGTDMLSRLLSRRAFVYGGEISYSLYMVHWLVLAVASQLIPESAPSMNIVVRIGIILSVIALAFFAAHLIYRFVEEPARKLIRGKPKRAEVPASI